jgi:ABC-type branched-subunit amino acid transport system substrate-binding protein
MGLRTASVRRSGCAVAAALVIAASAAACSSSGSGGSASGGTSGGTASGGSSSGTIKLLALYTDHTGAANAPEIVAGAEAAAMAINKQGGIAGHQISIIGCNDQFNAQQAAVCARTAVSDGVVAVIGDRTTFGSVVDPILQKAGIPSVAPLPEEDDYTSPISFPLIAGAGGGFVGDVMALAKEGRTKIGIASLGVPQLDEVIQVTKDAIASVKTPSGQSLSLVDSVSWQATTTDYSPIVESLKSHGADGVVLVANPQGGIGVLNAAEQLGVTSTQMQFTGGGEAYSNQEVQQLPDGLILAGNYPPMTAASQIPGLAQFESAMKAAAAAGVANATSADYDEPSLNAWLGVYAVDKALGGASGTVTASTLLTDLNHLGSVNLMGIINPWTPNATGPNNYPRLVNTKQYLTVVRSGQVYLTQLAPVETKPYW